VQIEPRIASLRVVPFPVDRTLFTTTHQSSSKLMINGTDITPTDICWLLFPSLVATVGETKLDAIDAIASSIYF
jgi:hypothetical protein